MKRVLNVRFAIAAFAIAATVVGYIAISPQSAAIFGPGVCSYYKDATYKKVVGARGTGCCGEVISWGVVTAYQKCERLYCLDVICPNPA